MRTSALIVALLALLVAPAAYPAVAPGTTTAETPAKRIVKLEKKVAALQAEVARLRPYSPGAITGLLNGVKQATARFATVEAAAAAGYVPGSPCEASPQGGMGFHYVSPAANQDPKLKPLQPEVLLYEPTPAGLSLVGLEYFTVDRDQNLATDDDRPTLFGRAFDGPMLGHSPTMPIHYDLHVWLHKRNPSGLFAQWNPEVRCS